MHAVTTVAVVAALACSVQGFSVGPIAKPARAATALSAKLGPEDFVPSETWYREYFEQDGLRYNMNKSDAEIQKEGDYNLWEAIFGATSNNAAKMKLKAEARKKAKEYSNEQEAQFWLKKYGHPRFYPAYIDKSGENELPAEAASPVEAVKKAASAWTQADGGWLNLKKARAEDTKLPAAKPSPIFPPVPAKVAPTVIKGGRSGPSTPYETNPGNPRDLPGEATTVAKASSSAPKAAKVMAAKVAEAPKAASESVDRVSRAAARGVVKAKGNLDNMPKRSSK